jgi:penicillin-binding protein 2
MRGSFLCYNQGQSSLFYTRLLSVRRLFLLGLVMLVIGCTPQNPKSQPLPTLAPSPTAAINIDDANMAANSFLDAWAKQDFVTMYQLLSYNNQQAITFDDFKTVYEDTQNLTTMVSLSYTPRSLLRESDRVTVFQYDITFTTNILGEFSDSGRDMRLVLDRNTDSWRVAWSLGDIFPEMGDGATLRFEPSIPRRANIYDRNGEILADQNGIVVQVNVIQEDISDLPTCLATLSTVLNKSIDDIQAILNKAQFNWVVEIGTLEPPDFLTHQTTLESACNATFEQKAIRRYLRGSLMPNILGNVGYPDADEVDDLIRLGFDAETIIGKSGIERSWDETLRGKPGGRLSLYAPNGERLRVLAEATSQIPESLWLTIDSGLQEYVAQVLGEAYVDANESWGITSKGASAIVLDVTTGEILALVSYPSYDGNALNPFPAIGRNVANNIQQQLASDPRNPLLNRPTQGIYPSGSVMKIVDAIAVADSGVFALDFSYGCSGLWEFDGDVRVDWLAGGHGRVNIATALAQSCNPFFYQTGFAMNAVDPNLLPSYARRLGLGQVTGLTDLSEASGTIPDPEWMRINRGLTWTYSNAVNMAIGQGEVEITPLQMTRLYAGVANGGTLYQPQLVRETGVLDQRTFVATPVINGEFGVKPEVMALVTDGLCQVTTKSYGTAEFVFRNSPLQNIGICGKTGTAQATGDVPPHAWFMAFAPADNPQIAIGVMVENAGDGSRVAAPLTQRILEYYYFGPF